MLRAVSGFRSGIQAQVMLSVKASASETLKPGLAGMKAAEKAAPNAELVQMIGDLTALLARVDFMASANQVNLHPIFLPAGSISGPFLLHQIAPISRRAMLCLSYV